MIFKFLSVGIPYYTSYTNTENTVGNTYRRSLTNTVEPHRIYTVGCEKLYIV